MLYIRDIIEKKRKKEELTEDEIRFFISGYFKNEITDAQAAALLTEFHMLGLSQNELAHMVNAVAETGEELEIYRLSNKLTDIHALGGMSDKVILMSMAVINGLGYPTAKVISREFGMEDRLKSIPKCRIDEDIEIFKEKAAKNKIGVLKCVKNLAPVENKLYKLRYHISCDNDINLVAISIMSQKIALGFNNIFFEITYGKNAYVKTEADAKMLAKYLVSIGKKMMRNVGCCVTSFKQPTGTSYGNLVEIKEIYDAFSGKISPDLEETVTGFVNNILVTSKISTNASKNRQDIKNVIVNGKALGSFERLIASMGGDLKILKSEKLAKNIVPVMSNETGYVEEIDVNQIRMLGRYLNSIRTKEDEKIDVGAGIVFNRKIGDSIGTGEILAYIYTNNDTKIEQAVAKAREAFVISPRKVKVQPKITYEI